MRKAQHHRASLQAEGRGRGQGALPQLRCSAGVTSAPVPAGSRQCTARGVPGGHRLPVGASECWEELGEKVEAFRGQGAKIVGAGLRALHAAAGTGHINVGACLSAGRVLLIKGVALLRSRRCSTSVGSGGEKSKPREAGSASGQPRGTQGCSGQAGLEAMGVRAAQGEQKGPLLC